MKYFQLKNVKKYEQTILITGNKEIAVEIKDIKIFIA